MDYKDPRLQPGAYITDGKRLGEVLTVDGVNVQIEDCATGAVWVMQPWTLMRSTRLVKPVPAVPEPSVFAAA